MNQQEEFDFLTQQESTLIKINQQLEQEIKKILTITRMLQYYWCEKPYFSRNLLYEAFDLLEKRKNPFLYIRNKMDQELEDYRPRTNYGLSHDVFSIKLSGDN